MDNTGAEVIGDQTAHIARTQDVGTQQIQRHLTTVVVVGNNLTALKTFLRYLVPAHIRCPQGADARRIHALQRKDFISNDLERLHVVIIEDVVVTRVGNDQADIVTQTDVVPVLKKVLNVGMLQRYHLADIGIDRYLHRLHGKKHCRCSKQQKNNRPN